MDWSPTLPRMVTHQKEDHYRHGIWYFELSHKTNPMDGPLPSLGWSPTNQRRANHQKKVYYRLRIGHLDSTNKTKTN